MTNHSLPLLVATTGNPHPRESLATWLVDKLLDWMERARGRHTLAGLTENELKDIGLSRGDVDYEAGKPFWRG